MKFGHTFICCICKKDIDGNYHRYTSKGIDIEFYTCEGDCDKKFHSKYVEPFESEDKSMKYKIGDRVKIKTLKAMAENCPYRTIDEPCTTHKYMDERLKENFPDRILTIKSVSKERKCYNMEDIGWGWTNDEIECLITITPEPEDKSMKYKIGDKVKLIRLPHFDGNMRRIYDNLPNGVATIEIIDSNKEYYYMKEIPWDWKDENIVGLASNIVGLIKEDDDEPIKNRWEILDIRRD